MISTTTVSVLTTTTSLNVNNSSTIDFNVNTSISNYHVYTSSIIDSNYSNFTSLLNYNESSTLVFPSYIRTTSMVFCIIIMCLGVIGNVMVPIVIFKTKDMRNSTNIFLVNLSVADLMVLLVCTPTVLVEVNSKPETWVLGEEMCKAVPFVELTVAHASVLTILAISFERYYAICKPLKAGYICTKARASFICLLAWFIAAVFTSPMLGIAEYRHVDDEDGTEVPVCHTLANTFWSALYFLSSIFLFFIVPLLILLTLYLVIAKNLISNAAKLVLNKHIDSYSIRARRQVILMLGTVVLSFFLCLIPFRVFTLWIIIVPDENIQRLGAEKYYNILYFCRIMVYLNSAINPILYNLMSSKFRTGFIGCSKKRRKFYFRRSRNGTISTTATSCRSSRGSHDNYKVCFRSRNDSIFIKNCSESPDSNRSGDSHSKILKDSPALKSISRKKSTALDNNAEFCSITDKKCKYSSSPSPEEPDTNMHCLFEKNLPKCFNTEVEVISLHERFIKQDKANEQESFV
ncbi:hypothetical protein FQR65_LT08310 [Abscondita terminalis]|nr:hypothetical protein FQR65_LT08310 [Abscondita terminalis]